jgi:hypothetical protein
MFFTCRCGSGSLDVPVGQTPLLYKEGHGFLRQPGPQQPVASPELFCLGPGVAATRNLAARECGVSW